MKILSLVLSVFAITTLGAQVVRPDLKGDSMGITLSEFTTKHYRKLSDSEIAPPTSISQPGMFPEQIRDPALGIVAVNLYFPFEEKYDRIRQKTTPLTTIATIPARIDYYFMHSRMNVKDEPKLYHIRAKFDVSGYSTVRGALIVKYGEPKTEEKSTLQNRMGVTFENILSTWEFQEDSIVLTKLSGDIETSLVEFRDKARIVEFVERLKESRKKKANDL